MAKFIGANRIIKIDADGLIGNWNANIFYVDRKKSVLLINDKTCYSIIIPNISKKQMEHFQEIFIHRLLEQFEYDGIQINKIQIDQLSGELLNFTTTNNNRPIIGTMTQFIKDLKYLISYHDEELSLVELNNTLTNNYVTALSTKKSEMQNPIELMKKEISQMKVYV